MEIKVKQVFQIKGRGTVFLISKKENNLGAGRDITRGQLLKHDNKVWKVTGFEISTKNDQVADLVGLLVTLQ